MVIDPNLFDVILTPVDKVARVWLKANANEIPNELEIIGKDLDGKDYNSQYFGIDVLLESGRPVGGLISYVTEDEIVEIGTCDNYMDVWDFFKENATEDDIRNVEKGVFL